MIAAWGFDLDMSAVRLMRREADQWLEVARENIDGPDIEDRLMAMVNKIEVGTPVELFLPRDQILYTDIEVSSEAAARAEIEAALEGLTPYALDELEIDWLLTATGTARIAAIAKETLDEAAAFAEARGLAVAGYGSLSDGVDFPRNPSFNSALGPVVLEAAPTEVDDAPPETVEPTPVQTDDAGEITFSSVRETSRSADIPTTPGRGQDKEPVLLVDDATPVMQVKPKAMPPLDPGKPLDSTQPAPRVRTDIAAGTLSGAAASLTPAGPSIRVHSGPSRSRQTLIAFGVAAVLTVGIAAIVWSLLPLAPGRTNTAPAEASQTGLAEETEPPAEEVVLTEPDSLAPDLPVPEINIVDVALSESPTSDPVPNLSKTVDLNVVRSATIALASPTPDASLGPQSTQRLDRSPASFSSFLTNDPIQGLDGSEDASETTLDIYIAAIERTDLAFDAIALPSAVAFEPSDLPLISAAPTVADLNPSTEATLVDPTATSPDSVEPVTPPPEAEAIAPEDEEPVPAASLAPTALAAALTDRAPRARPERFVEDIERQRFGGRTRSEMARVLPPRRPPSAQQSARAEQDTTPQPSKFAVASSRIPRVRPNDFDAIVAAAIIQARTNAQTASASFETPDTSGAVQAALADSEAASSRQSQSAPRISIPSNASVSRQATVEDAIRLNRLNLVGVYGVPSDRRALIRLASGRYVKVKVGDRVDGGTVARINDSELIYRKGSRTLSLAMPKG